MAVSDIHVTSVTMLQPHPAILSNTNNQSMKVSDIHVTSVTMLPQQQAILSSTKNLSMMVSDIHVTSVTMLPQEQALLSGTKNTSIRVSVIHVHHCDFAFTAATFGLYNRVLRKKCFVILCILLRHPRQCWALIGHSGLKPANIGETVHSHNIENSSSNM